MLGSPPAEIWSDDLLDRAKDAHLLHHFLLARYKERTLAGASGAYVMNLDAEWGRGKTFFLTRFAQQVRSANHLAAYVNGWRDDNGQDPLVSVMVAIDDALKPLIADKAAATASWTRAKQATGELALSIAKGIIKTAAKKLVGDEIDNITDSIDTLSKDGSEDTFGASAAEGIFEEGTNKTKKVARELLAEDMRSYRSAIAATAQFKISLYETLTWLERAGTIKLPMFILIDELDRCRPAYAIELLERVKHIYDANGLVFVFGTNISQLSHAIKAVYGSEFGARSYLNRFFNRQYIFDEPQLDLFCKFMFSQYPELTDKVTFPPDTTPETIFSSGLHAFKLELRDAEQCFDAVRTAVSLWDEPVPILFPLLVAQVLLFHVGNIESFDISKKQGSIGWHLILKNVWVIPLPERHSGLANLDIASHVDYIRQKIFAPLNKVAEDGYPNDRHQSWVVQQLLGEFSTVHNNRWVTNNPPISVARRYASLVSGAGRLKAETA